MVYLGLLVLPHVVILLALACLCLAVAIAAWHRRQIPGAEYLAFAMLATTWWSFSAAIEAGIIGQAAKISWTKIEYIGFVNVVPLLVLFILSYTNRGKWIRWETALPLWILPLVTLALAWTNDSHGLIWNSFTSAPSWGNILLYGHGPGFWVFAAYIYCLYTYVGGLLVVDTLRVQRLYRPQYLVILLAVSLPPLAGLIYLTNLNPIPGLDWAPIGTAAAGVAFILGIYRLHLFDLVPVARSSLFERSINSILVIDIEKRIVDCNKSAQRLFGMPGAMLIGQALETCLASWLDYAQIQFESPMCRFEAELKQNPGCYVEVNVSHLRNGGQAIVGWLIVIRDITGRKQVEIALTDANQRLFEQLVEIQLLQDQLREQATEDVLTGLHNRRFLGETLNEELERARQGGYPVSLMMFDMDHFKDLNDHLGHKAGDLMLEGLGKLLRDKVRRSDIAVRYGGEEFLLVLPWMDEADALRRSEEWREEYADLRIQYRGQEIRGTVSIGIAVFPKHGQTSEEMICAADDALYAAKAAGRNCVIIKQ